MGFRILLGFVDDDGRGGRVVDIWWRLLFRGSKDSVNGVAFGVTMLTEAGVCTWFPDYAPTCFSNINHPLRASPTIKITF